MKPHSFCETPNENCTLNYCDENGCLNRKRELVEEYAIYNLAEEVYGKGVKEDYEEGFVDGYNKAKETLYTKEQLMEAIELARLIDYNGSNDYYMSEDEIIKALKP